ncbi:unnamed protein product [Acanthoscelides obtectus]|uniref:Centrobin n=1 Tax=Acanthoscelides obtectus TaxID=200917 RepID=A0A9P0JWC5_ACAOB|nr:unnamed protein product [Acanthoscelides obtectus]CAK1625287.1 Centrobin [Acanthoscelides obtectus]
MTDTDDTDELLLIPPDFFVINSESESCDFSEPYYNIVERLIQRVDNLQTRLKSIESSENSLHSYDMQNIRQESRRYNSSENVYYPTSTQSTPQKPHTKFKLSSLPCSPNIDRHTPSRYNCLGLPNSCAKSENSSPNKNDTMGEIDTFLSKVRTIKRLNAVRSLEKDFNRDFNSNDSLGTKSSKEVTDVMAELKKQQENLEALAPNKEPEAVKGKTWQAGDVKDSVPDYSMGVRDTLYDCGEPTTLKKIYNDSLNTSADKYPSSDSSSEPTQMTAFKRPSKSSLLSNPLHSHALDILNLHKQVQEDSEKKVKKKNKIKSGQGLTDNFGLLSLADIWGSNSQLLQCSQAQLSQKLKEENLRRQHCEDLILKLQNQNLELQQKLSVAVNVDETKNIALQQFQETLEKVILRLDKVYKEKQGWEDEVENLKSKHAAQLAELSRKVSFYEKEASRAINVAEENQEKSSCLEKRCSELQNRVDSFENNLRELHDRYAREVEKNKQLSDILSQKEIELNENKNTLNLAKKEVNQSRSAIDNCQKELIMLKEEYERIQYDLKESKAIIEKLTEQKKVLLKEMENSKKKEVAFQAEIEQLQKQIENSKMELRNFYQGQVELLVQNKLKEFQAQLDQAESSFKEEVKKRELAIAKTAASHIQQLSEKYTLEISLLEKKHQEEIRLHQIQVMQYKQQAANLQGELDRLQEKRMEIARQLQKIMEAQWAEAVKIITSAKSPAFDDKAVNTLDQLNSLKTRSYHNVEEVFIQQGLNPEKNENLNEGTCTSTSNEHIGDTPVSSKTNCNKPFSETEVQKYINLGIKLIFLILHQVPAILKRIMLL